MSFFDLASSRFSVRSYSPREVEEEKIEQLLLAAQVAPTAKNNQSFRIFLLQSEEALRKARECSPLTYGAPLIMLFCYNEEEAFAAPDVRVNFGLVDASIAATHVMMQATELGLGSVWVGYFEEDKIREKFALPANVHPASLLCLGYALNAEPSPRHSESKPLDELVCRL